MTAGWTLAAAILLPLIGALGITLAGQRSANLRETITLVTAAGLLTLVFSLLPEVLDGRYHTWQALDIGPGLAIYFRVEPLGMLFAGLASLLWLVNSIYSLGYMRGNREQHQTRYYACFALAITGAIGVAFAGNLLTLFLFYEALTLSTYPLVAHKGDAKTKAAARTYIGMLVATSMAFFLPAIVWTFHATGTLEFTSGGILGGHLGDAAVGLLLALFVFGIGKTAIMPVHRWLPAAMVAPTPVSALLHAVAVVKAGVFSLTKVIVYIFGTDTLAASASTGWLLYLAAFTVVAASVVAWRQTNLKRLLAYSTISQLSYVVMAAALFRPVAEAAAALHMVTHAFGKITLFFAAGSIYTASKKTELAQLRGIGHAMPWTMAAFTIGALSMIGLPATAGFISKWYLLGAAFEVNNYVVISVVIISTMLNAAYFLPLLYAAWFQSDSAATPSHGEAPLPLVSALTFTAALTVLLFFFNDLIRDLAWQMTGGVQ